MRVDELALAYRDGPVLRAAPGRGGLRPDDIRTPADFRRVPATAQGRLPAALPRRRARARQPAWPTTSCSAAAAPAPPGERLVTLAHTFTLAQRQMRTTSVNQGMLRVFAGRTAAAGLPLRAARVLGRRVRDPVHHPGEPDARGRHAGAAGRARPARHVAGAGRAGRRRADSTTSRTGSTPTRRTSRSCCDAMAERGPAAARGRRCRAGLQPGHRLGAAADPRAFCRTRRSSSRSRRCPSSAGSA